jgi:hypothetical protein
MLHQGKGARPRKPDDTVKRLSTSEPLWEAEPSPKMAAPGIPDPGRRPADPAPAAPGAGSRPSRRRSELRVNALLAAAAALLLAVGFLLGATLTNTNTNPKDPDPAASPATTGVQPSLPTSPPSSGTAGQGPPQPCMVAMERADQVISYLVARIRDQRLSDSVQAFVDARRACQQAAR